MQGFIPGRIRQSAAAMSMPQAREKRAFAQQHKARLQKSANPRNRRIDGKNI
jgi:hypothetical protein